MQDKNSFTAIVRKGEKQFVALCPEVDVVSQGYTIEEAVSNLKGAVELYVEEIGLPEIVSNETFLVRFDLPIGKVTKIIGE